jgi:hypothetical protein
MCVVPANPDISGIGVRIAIYLQNLLGFIPAIWAIWDWKVTDHELESAETQSTTNLVLAFAILISCIVQAFTLGLTSYHATVVLSLSWMNNTNAFIYFLLYVYYKSQGPEPQVAPQWSAWIKHVKDQTKALLTFPISERVSSVLPVIFLTDVSLRPFRCYRQLTSHSRRPSSREERCIHEDSRVASNDV